MRLPTGEHAALEWRLGEIAADFELLDVWALPVSGNKEEFADLVTTWAAMGDAFAGDTSSPTKFLFLIRERLGGWLGWDDSTNELPIPGCSETSLRDRLPDDLPALAPSDDPDNPFSPVFETDREWVAVQLDNARCATARLGRRGRRFVHRTPGCLR